jgi:hypothetical protein
MIVYQNYYKQDIRLVTMLRNQQVQTDTANPNNKTKVIIRDNKKKYIC